MIVKFNPQIFPRIFPRWVFLLLAVFMGLAGIAWIPFKPDKAMIGLQTGGDLSISKTHSGNFQIGASGIYTIEIANSGTELVNGIITVTDALPAGLAPVLAKGNDWEPCAFSGQDLECVYSNTAGLAIGSVLPAITIEVEVTDEAPQLITNSVSLANPNDTNSSNNTDQDRTVIEGLDLAVTKKVSPANPVELQTVVYTIVARNNGPNPATTITLSDQISTDLTFVAAQASRGSYNAATGIWSIANLAASEQVTLTLSATVKANTRGKVINNTAGPIEANQIDYDATNDSASAQFVVATTRLAGIVTSAITEDPLSGVTVVITDSVNRVYSQTTGTNGWYTFTNTLDEPLAAGVATVRAEKDNYFPRKLTPTIQVGVLNRIDIALDSTDLQVTLTDGKTTVVPGREYTYTITVKNIGSITVTNVIITDVLPTTLTYISDTLEITHTKVSNTTYQWKYTDDLGPDTQFDFDVRVKLADALSSATATVTNLVKVETSDPEINTSNNSATDVNTSTGTPNISISQTVSPTSVRTGSSTTYTIKVTNSGTAPATEFVISETFSNLFDLTSATTNIGSATRNTSTNKVEVKIDVLDTQQTATITVVARVNNTARSNTTVSSTASLTYKFGGQSFTRSSNAVSVQIQASSTLPGTGGIELQQSSPGVILPALISAVLLGILGLGAFYLAARSNGREQALRGWFIRLGLMFSAAALLFGFVTWALYQLTIPQSVSRLSQHSREFELRRARPRVTEPPIAYLWPSEPEDAPDVLPDFPIPTPTVAALPEAGEPEPDVTAVERVIIPAIQLDTIVKYVPYDGLSWLIGGLKQEVAWLGDTSWPGLGSNTVLAGHVTLRTGENGPFRFLESLQQGDWIIVYTAENAYTYSVRTSQTVEETDLSVVAATDLEQITLITCTDWNPDLRKYQRRLIINADLIRTRSLQQAFH